MGLNAYKIQFVLLLSLVLSFPVQASVYKWIDHQGVTHYSQTPPSHHSYTRINVRNANVPPAVTTQPAKPAQSTSNDKKPHKEKSARRSISDLKHRCQIARKDVKTLHLARRVRIVKKNGGVEWLNQAQRNRRLKKLHAFLKQYCK